MSKRLNLRKRNSLVKPVDVSPPTTRKLEIVSGKTLTSSSQKRNARSSGLTPIEEKTDEIIDSILPGSNEIPEKTMTDSCNKIDFKENEVQSEIIFTESNVKLEQLSVSGTSSHDKSESCGESEDSGIKEMEELLPSEDKATKAFDSSLKLAVSLDAYEDQNNDPNSKSVVKVDVKQSEMVKEMEFLEYKNSNDIEINPSKHLSPVVLLNRCENAVLQTCTNSEQPSSPDNTTTDKKINIDTLMTSSEVVDKYNLSDPSISPKSCIDSCTPKSPVILVTSADGKVISEKPSSISSLKEQKISSFSNSYVQNKNESLTDQLLTEIIGGDVSASDSTVISEKSKTTATEVVKNSDMSSELVNVTDRLNSNSTCHEHSEEMSVRVSEKESESVETIKNNSITNDSCGEDDYSLIVHVDDESILERRKDVEMFGDSKKNDLQNSMISKTLMKSEDPETVEANPLPEIKTSSLVIGVSSFQNDKTDSTNEVEQKKCAQIDECCNIVKDDTKANSESSQPMKHEGKMSLVTNEPSDEKMDEPECINESVDKSEAEETNCSFRKRFNNKTVGVAETKMEFLGRSQVEIKGSIKNDVEVPSESLKQLEHEEEKTDRIILGTESLDRSNKEENISCFTTEPSSEDWDGPVSKNESYEPMGIKERKFSLTDRMINKDIDRAEALSDSLELSEKEATTVSISSDPSENKEGFESINEPPKQSGRLSLSDSSLKKDTSNKDKDEVATVNVLSGEEGKMSSIVTSNEEREVICESVVQLKLSDKAVIHGNETDSVHVIYNATSCDESVSEKTGEDKIDSSLDPSSIYKNEEVCEVADSKVINQFIGQSPRSIETIGFSIIEKKSNLSGIITSSGRLIDTCEQSGCTSDVPSVSVKTLSSSKQDVAIKSMREQCHESISEKGFDTSIENEKIKPSEELDLEGEGFNRKCFKQSNEFNKANQLPTSAKSNKITDLNLLVYSEEHENEGIINREDFENSPHFSRDNETISIPQQKNNDSELLELMQSDDSKLLALPSNSEVEDVDRTSGHYISNLEYEEKVIHETTNVLRTSPEHSRYEVVRSKEDSKRSLLDCTSDFETKLEIDVSTRNVNDVHFCVHTKILSSESSVGTTKEIKGSESDLSNNSDSCKSVCGSSIASSDTEKVPFENSENQGKNNAIFSATTNRLHKGPAGTTEEVQESESDPCSDSDSCKSVRGSSIASSETEKVPSENSEQQDKNIDICSGSDATSVVPIRYELPELTRPTCSFTLTAHDAPSRYRDRSYSPELKLSDGLSRSESENSDETSDSSSENEEPPLSGKDFLDDEAEEGDESSITSSENFPDIIHVGCKDEKSTVRTVDLKVNKPDKDPSVIEFSHKKIKFKYFEGSSDDANSRDPLKKIETGPVKKVGYGVLFQEIEDDQTERQGQHTFSKNCFFRVQECSSNYLDNLNYSIVTSTSFTGVKISEQMEDLEVVKNKPFSTRNCKFVVREESDGKIFQSKNANFTLSPDCNSFSISDCTSATVFSIPSTKQDEIKTVTSNINRAKTKESKSKKSDMPRGGNVIETSLSCNLSNALSIEDSIGSRKENLLDNQRKLKSNKIISPAETNIVKCFGSTVEIENYEPPLKLLKTGNNTSSSSPIFTESELDYDDLSSDEETFLNTSGGCKHRYTASIQHLGTK